MNLTRKITVTIFSLLSFSVHSIEMSLSQIKLEKISYFSIGMNGFMGNESEGEKLYRLILKQQNPEVIFLDIAKNKKSTDESKLYAACGLHKLEFKKIDSLFNHYEEKEVSILNGDILRKTKFNDILSSIIKHGCDLN